MVLETACQIGDLPLAERMAGNLESGAVRLHILSALAFILRADATVAVDLHRQAKTMNASQVPPLAELHLNGQECGGLGDLFYVSAVVVKQLVDSNIASEVLLKGCTTILTLAADSGLHHVAETHLKAALAINPTDPSLQLRSLVMTPGVYENLKHLKEVRSSLTQRVSSLMEKGVGLLQNIDEFSLSPTFYFAYMGYNDQQILSDINKIRERAYPAMANIEISLPRSSNIKEENPERKIRVGFVSNHFRRHSICKLFCGIISEINRELFEVFVFSSLQENYEDSFTKALEDSEGINFVGSGMTVVRNRVEVVSRDIDILVYLDVGMTTSTPVWAASRLAPIQIATWGHPTTTGLSAIDFFISSDMYHADYNRTQQANSFYSEQLIRLASTGFYFNRPNLNLSSSLLASIESKSKGTNGKEWTVSKYENDDVRQKELSLMSTRPDSFFESIQLHKTTQDSDLYRLITEKRDGAKVILCPQFLPKMHPSFDFILRGLLEGVSNSILVMLGQSNKAQWQRTIDVRWRRNIGSKNMRRIIWLPRLKPEEHLSLLAIGDIMIDPFPFGGGVTTLEALSVCTPVITCPPEQTVPALAAGMIQKMQLGSLGNLLIANSKEEYVEKAVQLLGAKAANASTELSRLRRRICNKAHVLYNSSDSVRDWNELLYKLKGHL